jgi:hypothetical protein
VEQGGAPIHPLHKLAQLRKAVTVGSTKMSRCLFLASGCFLEAHPVNSKGPKQDQVDQMKARVKYMLRAAIGNECEKFTDLVRE